MYFKRLLVWSFLEGELLSRALLFVVRIREFQKGLEHPLIKRKWNSLNKTKCQLNIKTYLTNLCMALHLWGGRGREECEEWLIIGIIFSYEILGNYFFRTRGVFWKSLCEIFSLNQMCVTCWKRFNQKLLSAIFLADNKMHQINLRFIKFRHDIFHRRIDTCREFIVISASCK